MTTLFFFAHCPECDWSGDLDDLVKRGLLSSREYERLCPQCNHLMGVGVYGRRVCGAAQSPTGVCLRRRWHFGKHRFAP